MSLHSGVQESAFNLRNKKIKHVADANVPDLNPIVVLIRLFY